MVCARLIEPKLILYAVGRPCADRQWMECYAQLVGTVLSLWEASALDAAAGADVPATFINLADASIKMVWNLHSFSLSLLFVVLLHH